MLVAQCRLAAAMPRAQREVVRPEERAGGDADKYYDRGVTEAYTELNVRTQGELTARCLDMLGLEGDARGAVLLDIGCGSGLSGETLTRHGYRAWLGIDASAAMLERATRGRSSPKRTADEKEPPADEEGESVEGCGKIEDPPARGAVLRGDFSQGLPFRAGAFDGCVSVSAVQWLCAGTKSEDEAGKQNEDSAASRRENLRRFFACLRFALRPGARAALQVYPRTVLETGAFEAAVARTEHLSGTAVVAFPHENASKKLFVCALRDDADADADASRARRSAPPTEKETGRPAFLPPRCLLAWPHAATCEVAWHDYLRARVANAGVTRTTHGGEREDAGERGSEKQKHLTKRATRARSDREHVAAQRRALRSLRRARVAAYAAYASRTEERHARHGTEESSVEMLAPFDAVVDGVVTETVDAEERVVRDGSLCPCARIGVVARARVVSEPGAASSGARAAQKPRPRPDRDGRDKPPRLEDPLRLTALGAPRSVETLNATSRASGVATRVAFQEFVLQTSFGDFGVFAVEAEERTKRDAQGEEGERWSERHAGSTVLSRARAALGARLGSAGSMVCAAVLSRSSDAETRGGAPEKEESQAWILWWPSRDVGGKSTEPHAGFGETSGLRQSVRDAFSEASFSDETGT